MSKKIFAIISVLTAAIAFHSCTLPSSALIKGKPKVSLPIKIGTKDFDKVVMDALEKAIPDESTTIMDHITYLSEDGKNIQAYVIHFPILKDQNIRLGGLSDTIRDINNMKNNNPNFNVDDYLDSIPPYVFSGFASDNYHPKMDDDPIDMSKLNRYLGGFHFFHVVAKMYVSGPTILNDLGAEMKMWALYTHINGSDIDEDLLEGNNTNHFINSKPLSLEDYIDSEGNYIGKGLPNGNWPDGGLPDGGTLMESLPKLLDDEPADLHFHYQIQLPFQELKITREMLDNADDLDKPVNVEILLLLPLLFTSGTPNGADVLLFDGKKDLEDEEEKDIFGRTSPSDFIKSLSMSISLSEDLFTFDNLLTNGKIYLDDRDVNTTTNKKVDNPDKIMEWPLTKKSMNLSFSEENMAYINNPNNIPYSPEIRIHVPPGEKMLLLRTFKSIDITFEVEIEYWLEDFNFGSGSED